jgi:hypothetical protein
MGHISRTKEECWIRRCLALEVDGKRERQTGYKMNGSGK